MTKRFLALCVLMCAAPIFAQTTTTYTGTIKDLTGAVVTSGRITWSLNAPSGGVIPGTGSFTATTVSCLINSSGSPVSSVDGVSPCTIVNNSSLTPTGTSYTLCRQPYNVTPGSCFVTYANGGSVDISTLVPTPATQPSYGLATTNAANTFTQAQTFSAGISSTTGTFSSAVTAPTVTSSVNTQFNVISYGAKGDCTTDDHTAIQAAMTAAAAYNPPAAVYFPKAPGGCYLTSTLTWNGASLIGQPVGGGIVPAVHTNGVVIKGKPSQDILHVGDPTTTSGTGPVNSWSIEHITFVVDDSVDASSSFPHRKPGRTFNDAAMTSGSAVLSTSNGSIGCDDIGQKISVAGAVTSSTIVSVTPCYSQTGSGARTITLANNASATVSSATGYLTPAGIPLTTTIGNCAIAFDNSDGNSSDWVMTSPSSGFLSNLGDAMHDVSVTSLSGAANGQNNSCGIFTQGVWGFYSLDARSINVSRLYWGVAQVCSDVNPTLQSCSNDFQKWDHGSFGLDTFPWLEYNGGQKTMEDIEITALNGPQFIAASNVNFDAPALGYFKMPEFETASGTFGYPWRNDGVQNTYVNAHLGPGSQTNPVLIGGSQNRCESCAVGGPITFNGNGNIFDISDNLDSVTVTDNGVGNKLTGGKYGNPPGQKQPTRQIAVNNFTSPYPYNTLTADFLTTGTFYNNNRDLLFLPADFVTPGGCGNCALITDAASPIGTAWQWGNGATVIHFANDSSYLVGSNVGAGKFLMAVDAKCTTASSFTFIVYANGVSTASGSLPCNTSTYSIDYLSVNLASVSGQTISFQITGDTVDVAYAGFIPAQILQLTATTATLTSGTVTVSNSAACTPSVTCVYKLANCGKNASTGIGTLSIGTVSAGTSFVINSLGPTGSVLTTDASTVCWQIN